MTKRFALMMLVMSFAVWTPASAGVAAANAGAAEGGSHANLAVKTFQFKHKDADRAAAVVKPLMSAEGSISIQPSTNSVVITDRPENVKAIAAALDQFDTPPQAFKLSVRLIVASRTEAAAPRTPDDLKDIAPNLAMLRFNTLESLGSANIETSEGQSGLVDFSAYHADFKLGEYDPASDSVQLVDFRVSKLQDDQLTPILKKATMNLKLGQTVIVGAGRPDGSRALMVILAARR